MASFRLYAVEQRIVLIAALVSIRREYSPRLYRLTRLKFCDKLFYVKVFF